MLIVKIMSAQNLPDESQFKNYTIVQIGDRDRIQFGYAGGDDARDDLTLYDENSMFVIRHGEFGFERYELTGMAYVMNKDGKTIDSHGVKKSR